MRILIASSSTIPGYSGGWTTTLDMLGDRHEAMYLIVETQPGIHSMEGVEYLGLGLAKKRKFVPPVRLILLLRKVISPLALKWTFRRFNADFVLCLDEDIGFSAKKTGLPYAMRFHTRIDPGVNNKKIEGLLKGALFSTVCHGASIPGVEEILHNQDLSRFNYAPAVKPERVLLLTCINDIHEPDLFVEGISLSKSLRGDIIGTGPAKKRIEKVCRQTGGRVRVLDPVPRLKLGQLSGQYQIGVATLKSYAKSVYQMKVNMYLACGMHTVVKPFTHIAKEAPELVDIFSTPRELADRLDEITGRWRELEERRKKAREWVMENYSVEKPRAKFEKILKHTFPNYR